MSGIGNIKKIKKGTKAPGKVKKMTSAKQPGTVKKVKGK